MNQIRQPSTLDHFEAGASAREELIVEQIMISFS